MNALRCLYLDRLLRQLIDSYGQLKKPDKEAVLAGTEVLPPDIDALDLAIAEHRSNCPVCIRIDRTTSGVDRSLPSVRLDELGLR